MPTSTEQIVVATGHVPLVLASLGVEPEAVEHNARLGLTLVELTADLDGIAAKLIDEVPEQERTTVTAPYREPSTPLDRLLTNLRGLYEFRYSGWTPTMGKNRTLTGIQFLPYASAGGFDRPEPVDPPIKDGAKRGTRKAARLRRVRVGLMDTRLVPHSRIEGRYLVDTDALDRRAKREVREGWRGHATFIANMVLNEAPTAELDVRTALRREQGEGRGGGRWTMPLWRFAECLAEYEDSGVQVLNLSLGLSTGDGKPPLVLERAIASLTSNMVVVAAAGNHGTGRLTDDERKHRRIPERKAVLFPAALDGVLSVGALDAEEKVAEFNPRGVADEEVAPWIDLFAPGTDIISTYLGEDTSEKVLVPLKEELGEERLTFTGWAKWTGTSFAAAKVTGAVAAKIAAGASPDKAVAAVRDKYRRPDVRPA